MQEELDLVQASWRRQSRHSRLKNNETTKFKYLFGGSSIVFLSLICPSIISWFHVGVSSGTPICVSWVVFSLYPLSTLFLWSILSSSILCTVFTYLVVFRFLLFGFLLVGALCVCASPKISCESIKQARQLRIERRDLELHGWQTKNQQRTFNYTDQGTQLWNGIEATWLQRRRPTNLHYSDIREYQYHSLLSEDAFRLRIGEGYKIRDLHGLKEKLNQLGIGNCQRLLEYLEFMSTSLISSWSLPSL